MFTKEQKVRLGVFLAASAGLLAVFVILLLLPHLRAGGTRYFVNFRGISVSGLYNGAPVKYQGVEIGKVNQIRVSPADLDSVIVRVEIQKSFPVKKDMSAVQIYAGITGQKFLELSGGTPGAERVRAGGEIAAGRGLGDKAEEILANVDTAVRGLNSLLSPENQGRISHVSASAERSAEVVSRVLGAREENLAGAIANIERATREFGNVTANLKAITDNLSALTARLDASSGEALDSISKRFSDEELGSVMRNLQAFVQSASSSVQKVEGLIINQQRDIRLSMEGFGQAVENFSKFARDVVEDPTLFLRSRREKK